MIAPTTYAPATPNLYQKLGISLVIWSNHLLRASVLTMRKVAQSLFETQSSQSVNTCISSIPQLFELVNQAELEKAEEKYASHACSIAESV